MSPSQSPSSLRKWIIAGRPWSFPASSMPVVFGTSLGVVIGGAPLSWIDFLLALAAMIILHAAANMISDVFDFRRGLDRDITPVSGAIVRGWLTPSQVTSGAAAFFAAGSLIGLFLVLRTGWPLLVIGAIGLPIGIFYPFLKRRAFGDLAVFMNFGILGALGAWTVQARHLSWIPVVWTVPMAMLVSAILHANNWRDSITDTEKRVKTVAGLLGDSGSLRYYHLLVFGPFLILLGLIFLPRVLDGRLTPMPVTFLLVFLALPAALELSRRARRRRTPRRPLDFVILDGATANYNLLFGLLCTASIWLHLALKGL
jgi:1,4-dihydroxy-2-naphthoate octaprenyltransferase